LRRELPRRLDVAADEQAGSRRRQRGGLEALLNFSDRDHEHLPARGVALSEVPRLPPASRE
jgi:hypothetical protein